MRDRVPAVAHSCEKFIRRVAACCRDVHWIEFHEEVLDRFPASVAKVINVDRHSDYVTGSEELNEGTWVNYVPKSVKRYEWRYPYGYRGNTFACADFCRPGSDNPADYPIPWSYRPGLNRLPLHEVQRVVICHSPNWGNRELQDEILERLIRIPALKAAGLEVFG